MLPESSASGNNPQVQIAGPGNCHLRLELHTYFEAWRKPTTVLSQSQIFLSRPNFISHEANSTMGTIPAEEVSGGGGNLHCPQDWKDGC